MDTLAHSKLKPARVNLPYWSITKFLTDVATWLKYGGKKGWIWKRLIVSMCTSLIEFWRLCFRKYWATIRFLLSGCIYFILEYTYCGRLVIYHQSNKDDIVVCYYPVHYPDEQYTSFLTLWLTSWTLPLPLVSYP